MEHTGDDRGMLDLLIRPAFSVSNGIIRHINHAAAGYALEPGKPVAELLASGHEEYAALQSGCLYLTVRIGASLLGASVTKMDRFDVFTLDTEGSEPELHAISLAARELREPLADLMVAAEQLLPALSRESGQQTAQMNRSLHQLLRLVGNMSDAARYTGEIVPTLETRDICAIFDEVFEKAAALAAHTGVQLEYHSLQKSILCPVDTEKLERAVYNLISNAIKFSQPGDRVQAALTLHGSKLHLTVEDSGSGIPAELQGSLYARYLRQSNIEDSRHGIGLGMVMVRSAAIAHGGTVLMQQREGGGTKITMTFATRRPTDSFRSPVMHIDYTGEHDHGLIELADLLPAEVYSVN